MNQTELFSLLPHRPPMLLLDGAEKTDDNTAVGTYTVKGDEWFLQGHFPGNPVVPGVILCEMLAQTCCVLLSEQVSGEEGSFVPYFTGLDGIRFREKVLPGSKLTFTCRITRSKAPFYFAEGKGVVMTDAGEKEAVSGKFSFALIRETK
ncbi:MAG TPA: beta-hydroxyacyl-ACP dehydratase [Clostridiales bacterium]|jgi:3-hydroxyacyl-[acyl-carrier-protein] dehydratase|nr:beta-hydroxyacyl-ACP dehydratase [Clostridiales bacterium]